MKKNCFSDYFVLINFKVTARGTFSSFNIPEYRRRNPKFLFIKVIPISAGAEFDNTAIPDHFLDCSI